MRMVMRSRFTRLGRLGEVSTVAKCSKCGSKAVIKIPYARMNLCEMHFIEYFEGRVATTVKKYDLLKEGESVLVAVSGGKDSVALLSALTAVAPELRLKVMPLHIHLGLGEYSDESLRVTKEVSRKLGVNTFILSLEEVVGATIPELSAKSSRPPCAVCGLVKRYVLNAAAIEWGVDAVATGHHIDDLAPYALKNILLGDMGAALKLAPVTTGEEGYLARRVRPLYEVTERECLIYAIIKGLPFVKTLCPNVFLGGMDALIRRFLYELDLRHPGVKLRFMRSLARMATRYGVSQARTQAELTRCKYCGLPSRSDVCGFCRLTERVLGSPAGPMVREALKDVRASSH